MRVATAVLMAVGAVGCATTNVVVADAPVTFSTPVPW